MTGMLSAAQIIPPCDKVMEARGWNRLVGVLQADELVAVYAPREPDSARDVSVCVVVLHERELVLVRVRADWEPLLELASRRMERHRPITVAVNAAVRPSR